MGRVAMKSPDWFRIISDLIYHGLPMKKVGEKMDVKLTDSLLRSYRAGVQPMYPRGDALLKLWCKTTGKQEHEAPQTEWIPPHNVGRRGHASFRSKQRG
jgi:hypothetical protein